MQRPRLVEVSSADDEQVNDVPDDLSSAEAEAPSSPNAWDTWFSSYADQRRPRDPLPYPPSPLPSLREAPPVGADVVSVARDMALYRAKVLKVDDQRAGPVLVRVHFYGWSKRNDEFVTLDQLFDPELYRSSVDLTA
eukprot:2562809-Prorocentrum_lima.AAC.1